MRIAVIGAGAAGMFAAICAAERGAQVRIYEHMEEAGKKLLMTGNGKCNLTNLRLERECYHTDSDNQDVMWQVLSGFSSEDAVAWFEKHGLMVRSRDGYVYPYCEQASVVRQMLLRSCEQAGVSIRYSYDCYRTLQITSDGRFQIGEEIYDRLILACGGKSARYTGSDGSGYELAKRFGHRVIEPKPALVQLHTDLPDFKQLAGVRAQGSVTIGDRTERGEIQFTEFGISGIAVFQLSRHVVKAGFKIEAHIDLCPEYSLERLKEIVIDLIGQAKNKTLLHALTGTVHTKILEYMLLTLGYAQMRADELQAADKHEELMAVTERIAEFLKGMCVPIIGSHKLDAAQVTQGGIPLFEVDASLQSVHQKGLFLAGEMLDVDGVCGGYNLQWAWASGYAAAQGCLVVKE